MQIPVTQRKCKGDLTLVSNMLINSRQFKALCQSLQRIDPSLLVIGCTVGTHPTASTNQKWSPIRIRLRLPHLERKSPQRSERLIFYNNMCQLSPLLIRQAVQQSLVSSLHLWVIVSAVYNRGFPSLVHKIIFHPER